jgi:hypothetical protein
MAAVSDSPPGHRGMPGPAQAAYQAQHPLMYIPDDPFHGAPLHAVDTIVSGGWAAESCTSSTEHEGN